MLKTMEQTKSKLKQGPTHEWWRDEQSARQLLTILMALQMVLQRASEAIRANQGSENLQRLVRQTIVISTLEEAIVRRTSRDGMFEVTRLEWTIEMLCEVIDHCIEAGFDPRGS